MLSMDFLRAHNPSVNWVDRTVSLAYKGTFVGFAAPGRAARVELYNL